MFFILQENIGQRTRSKLSLSDTPLETIEKAFVPPDITTDMYDSECDDDDWKDFLKNFTEPLSKLQYLLQCVTSGYIQCRGLEMSLDFYLYYAAL